MLGDIRGDVRFKEFLSFHTSIRTGGPADVFVVPQNVEDIRHALSFAEREQFPVVIIGGGHNFLASDRGVRGVVIKLEGALGHLWFNGQEVWAGAGVGLSALLREAAARDLGGMEALIGIPATIGGAVATNAGTVDGRISDHLTMVYFLHPDGTLDRFVPGHVSLGHHLFDVPGAVIVAAKFQMHRRPSEEVFQEFRYRMKGKRAVQPMMLAVAGEIWKAVRGYGIGQLIERVGLKGKRIGGAEISTKHSNFIINRGGATAADIRALMVMTADRVFARFGVQLEPEITTVGF